MYFYSGLVVTNTFKGAVPADPYTLKWMGE